MRRTRIPELRQRLGRIADDLTALADKVTGENRPPTDEEKARSDQLATEQRSVAAQLELAESAQEAEFAATGERRSGDAGEGRDWRRQMGRYSVFRAIASQMPGFSGDAALEIEISQELRSRNPNRKFRGGITIADEGLHLRAADMPAGMERRGVVTPSAFRTDTAGAGPALVNAVARPDLYVDALRAALPLVAAGARYLDGLRGAGSVQIPRMRVGGAVDWIGEDEDAPPFAPQLDEFAMSPRTVAGQTTISRRMVLTSDPSIEAILRADMVNAVAEAITAAALNGDGVKQPKGILRYVGADGLGGVVALGTPDGGPIDWDDVVSLYSMPKRRNVNGNALAWITNSRVTAKLMTSLKIAGDGSGGFLLDLDGGDVVRLAGRPLYETEVMPSAFAKGARNDLSGIVVGDWTECLIGRWSGTDILVDPYTGAGNGSVRLVTFSDVDVAFRRLASFAYAKDVQTS